MNPYALIMAGGEGTRFYPVSTPEKPKQFLNLFGNASLLQHTAKRITPIINSSSIFVATNERYLSLVREQLPEIVPTQLIGEPLKKNTAPCIALTTWLISHINPDAVICVFPADHYIGDNDLFLKALNQAMRAAIQHHKIVTLGILPSWPSTEYGYIKKGIPIAGQSGRSFQVERFVEKPKEQAAQEYCKSGQYLWNSGIFIFQAKVMLEEIAFHLPNIYQHLITVPKMDRAIPKAQTDEYFQNVESISIDYGVLEKSNNVVVLETTFQWSDLGSFEALKRVAEKEEMKLNPELVALSNEQTPARIEKPWGHEVIWTKTNQYVSKILHIKKGHRLSYQYHELKEESIYLLEGSMDFDHEQNGQRKTIRLQAGNHFHIPSYMKHRMIAVEDCKVLEVSTPHLEDVVRLEDAYGRTSNLDLLLPHSLKNKVR